MQRRHVLRSPALAALALPGLVSAQSAGKTITIVSPFPPGGITDIVARAVQPLLAKAIDLQAQ